MIPGDVDVSFCGSAYIVVYLDHNRKIVEWNEANNMMAFPIKFDCHDSKSVLSSHF